MKNREIYTLQVSNETHNKIKIEAAKARLTIKEFIEFLIKEYIEKNK